MTLEAFIDGEAWDVAAGCRRAAENVLLEMGLQGDELDRALDRIDAMDGVNFEQTRDVFRAFVAAIECPEELQELADAISRGEQPFR